MHLAAADVHVVGERVRELGRDRADLAADAAEVVEEPRAVCRQLGEERGQGEDVRAPIIPRATGTRASATSADPSAAPTITSVEVVDAEPDAGDRDQRGEDEQRSPQPRVDEPDRERGREGSRAWPDGIE